MDLTMTMPLYVVLVAMYIIITTLWYTRRGIIKFIGMETSV